MLVTLEQIEKLIDALERLYKTLGVKSRGGRFMLGTEIIIGIFLIVILSLMAAETFYESIYAAVRGQEYTFHSGRYFAIAIVTMFVSMVALLVREFQE